MSREFGCKCVDGNWEVLSVWSVLKVGSGSGSGIITGGWQTLYSVCGKGLLEERARIFQDT